MKKLVAYILALTVVASGVLTTSLVSFADEAEGDILVEEEERSAVVPIDTGGLVAVYGGDIEDGTYAVAVKTDSSMFRMESAELSVLGDEMSAVVTLAGTGFDRVFAGSAAELLSLGESAASEPLDAASESYSFEVPVEALNKALTFFARSARKQKWYEHSVVFYTDGIPEDKIAVDLNGAKLKLVDGAYNIEAELTGGSGKASIESPLDLTVESGVATARIVWSSANYDYMLVDGKIYFPMKAESEEHSTFYIPVYNFDEPRAVVGDTTAMSTPHEIEYEIVWDAASLKAGAAAQAEAVSQSEDAEEATGEDGAIEEKWRTREGYHEYSTAQKAAMWVIAAVVCLVVFLKFRKKKYPWQMTEEERAEFVDKKRHGSRVARDFMDKAGIAKTDGAAAEPEREVAFRAKDGEDEAPVGDEAVRTENGENPEPVRNTTGRRKETDVYED